jgi:hypothetical protein
MSGRLFTKLVRRCAQVVADSSGQAEPVHAALTAVLDLPSRQRFLRPLSRRLAAAFAAGPRPRLPAIERFLRGDAGFLRGWSTYGPRLRGPGPGAAMRPAAGRPAAWGVPQWTSAAAVAADLGCPVADLGWLAGGLPSRPLPPGQRHHYRYRWIAKATGGQRLVEEPKGWLKAIQRRLLRLHLDRIPVHPCAHGFVPGRSLHGFAAPHAGRYVVVRLDLEHFFTSVRGARVIGLFMAAGHPERVARLLAGLCCNRVPAAELAGRDHDAVRELLADWHLPQGAPTSPALANACAYRLDCRLAGLARAAGASYTRYADDLVFSGDREFAVGLEIFLIRAHAVIIAEGFRLHRRKTRIMRASARQHVGGLVVNAGVHCPRRERELLEATLFNCVRHGPRTQDRDGHADFRAHLAGRISWVAQHHPVHAARLRELFAAIAWP